MKHDIIIIGGGASGIIAAICAKNYGINAAIIEGNDRIGKKLLTTGNGRCNITNSTIDGYIQQYLSGADIYLPYHSSIKDFFVPVLNSFKVKDTVDFFNSLGLQLTTLENGKMYPMSLQASSVLDILRMSVEELEIPIYFNHKVDNITTSKNGFTINTKSNGSEEIFKCSKLIMCTGGKSASVTGSDGSGYNLAKKLGHSIINTHPALVQLKLNYKNLKALSGIKFDGFAEIFVDNESKKKEFGEILFTDYGISGPPILQLSRIASCNLHKKITLKINMLPDYSEETLDDFIENRKALFGYRSIHNSFIGIINKKIIPILLKEAGISDIHKPLQDMNWKEKKALIKLLISWEFEVTDTNSFSNAQVTSGGISTEEINSITLESKIVKGLYFAGEIIDVDGDCGGFNLQWAWSSGYVAAKSCAE
ncbi:NAD(P)/FAD-dependent oxidoreductase [Clostridium sp. 19966]|uniref:NAD(P)/FAD-dependent oxidoreductase n=1 Tax=Clostridium sp. 19966 TaxID=2768166 RepID=UPI0028DDC880|nr:NAD(P)/FAD-dependent oxidoreductase [Clostridium sp. 19966]MDT8718670.1 NAD(P)/FAD-dependent oxidoreductase [Clostridium sp. 19966]